MQPGKSKALTPRVVAEVRELGAMPDSEIDTSDSSVVGDWTGAERGRFYGDRQTPDHAPAGRRSGGFLRSPGEGLSDPDQ